MAEPLTVNLAHLRAALMRAMDTTEKLLGPKVTLDVDYYWHLPVQQAFNMVGDPQTFTVGQVSDDLATNRDERERQPEEAWHDLSHLVGVLRALEVATQP